MIRHFLFAKKERLGLNNVEKGTDVIFEEGLVLGDMKNIVL